MGQSFNSSNPAPRVRQASESEAERWDQRYRDGSDGWELDQLAPPMAMVLRRHPLALQREGRVLVPGYGRGHEAALLAELGFSV